jgi:ABC-type Fe3+-hydroxamate transport system substrate-binding protein
VISLIPSASLVLRALGVSEALVGRTDFDTAAVFQNLPSVGGGLHPNLEAIVILEPELVIRFAGDSDPATHTRLEEFGIPHLALRPDGIQDIRRSLGILGAVMGREAAADSILDEMDSNLAEIRKLVGDRPPLRVAFLLGGSPPWVAGPDSYIDELLEVAGGANAFSDLSALYGLVNVESFLAREIDLILAPEGAELGIPDLRIPVKRVSASLEIPGPELASDAWRLARILHPEVFR